MGIHALLEDADGLIALAESVATVFSEKHDELGVRTDVEALLRAGIAAATAGVNVYLAVFAQTRKSAVASRYLAEARRRCRRSVEQLRRRVRYSIAHLSRVVDEKQLVRGLEYAPL